MKRISIAIAIFCLAILAACGNDDTVNKDKKPAVTNEEPAVDKDAGGGDSADDSKEEQSVDDEADHEKDASDEHASDHDTAESDNSLSNYEEYPYLDEQIDNLDSYEPIVETDNPNKRVILYKAENSEEKKYKSIFIKKQNRLKIIKLDDQGEIFNEVIK